MPRISISAVARDEQGQIVKETNFTVTDSTYTSGGIAMLTKGHSGDTNEDGPWIGYWDNLKVTLENGTVVLDDGTPLKIQNLIGFAEKVKNRW